MLSSKEPSRASRASRSISEILPPYILELVLGYYGQPKIGTESDNTRVIQWTLSVWKEPIKGLVGTYPFSTREGFYTLKHIQENFGVESELRPIPYDSDLKIVRAILAYAVETGNVKPIEGIFNLGLVDEVREIPFRVPNLNLVGIYEGSGMYGLRWYIDTIGITLNNPYTLRLESPNSAYALENSIFRSGNIEDIIWICQYYGVRKVSKRADGYMDCGSNGIIARSVYSAHGIDGLDSLFKNSFFAIEDYDISSGCDYIARDVIKKGDLKGLEWLFQNYYPEIHDQKDIYKYYTIQAKIKETHSAIAEFFERKKKDWN